jgi:integration host factor subunit alpha
VGLPKKEMAKIVETVFDIIKETLQREDKILISGFGNFVIRNKRARRGRNIKTGDRIEITPRRILRFKPSPVLKDSLNRPGNQMMSLTRKRPQGISE